MKVILTEDVKKLGQKGDIVEVANGYGRNYLIPRGMAEEATKEKIKEIKEKNVSQEKKKEREKSEAEELKARIDGKSVTIKARTGSSEKLFGAVTSKEISDILQEELGVSIDKKKIDVPEPIKNLGEHQVRIKLFPEVQAEVKVIVASE
ncbi:MAG TPA: 50S ribosomal protein L9 [Syntrophomonadaceae bacterium]|nr:50S ribosomal protein L9 [Syntrophomonadaceae bacterium]